MRKRADKTDMPAPRSSLATRISVYYAWMMLVAAIPQMVLFIVIYGGLAAFQLNAPVREALDAARQGALPASLGIYAAIAGGDGEVIADNIPGGLNGDYLARDAQGHRDFVSFRRNIELPDGAPGTVRIAVDITERVSLLYGLLIALVALNVFGAISLIKFGRRASDRLFKPIRDIAMTAQNLSENNLNERINVEGTKSELQDMAAVVNDMLDRIEEAYNSQKLFVSDASHELRTPIAVIQGYAEMLDRWGKQEPEIRDEAIAAILSESKGMQNLVEQLLFLARHDRNAYQADKEFFDAEEMVSELARETAIIAGGRQVLVGKMESAIISGDRMALKRALRIFVENAVKYTGDGGRITLSCLNEGDTCRMSVEDTGMGISAGELNKVFDRFYRADPARAGTPGHGLGLSIARLITLSHGGKIEVKSKPGKGSKFSLVLPM